MAISLVYSTSGITSGKKVCRDLKMAVILKILKYVTQLHFDLRYEKIVPNYAKPRIFHGDDVIDDVTGWPQSRSSIFMFGRCSLREQVARTMSRQYMQIILVFLGYTCQKRISINNTFPRSQVKGQRHRLTGWPWHLSSRNSVNLGIIKMKQQLQCKK